MLRERIELPKSISFKRMIIEGEINRLIFPELAPKGYIHQKVYFNKKQTMNAYIRKGVEPIIYVLPGLFADYQSNYILYLSQILKEQFKNEIWIMEGFASYNYHKDHRVPLTFGKLEAKLFSQIIKKDSLVIGFSYSGLIALWLDLLTDLNLSYLLINPVIDPYRSLDHLDNLRGFKSWYFERHKRKFFKLYDLEKKNLPTFKECIEQVSLPYLEKNNIHPELGLNPSKHLDKLKSYYTLLACDDDPIVSKNINSEILSEVHDKGFYFDLNYGFHTSLFRTHPFDYEPIMTNAIFHALTKK